MTDAVAAAAQVETIAYAAAGVAAILGAASLLMPAARRLALPYTVLVAVFGAAVGALVAFAPEMGGGVLADTAMVFSDADLPSEALLYLFLPPLLFAAGLQMDLRRLIDDIWPVLVLAVVAVVLCCVIVGATLLPFIGGGETGLAFAQAAVVCLLIGAIVAPTDTAAILSIFKDIGAPRRLSTIVEGESLFNDAAAIALVVVLTAALSGQTEGGVGGAALEFAKHLGGGLALGYVAGRAAAAIAPFARGFVVAETTVTLTLAYVAYVVAQLVLHVSGIVAVVAAAMVFAYRARTRLTPGSWSAMQALWQQLDFWATTLIFVFAAMQAPEVLAGLRWSDLAALAALYVAALVARAIVTLAVMPLLVRLRLSQPFSPAYRAALTWGGVRGAVTVVLALFVAENDALGDETARFVLVLAFGYVLLTLFVNATTLRPMMRALGLNRLDARERMVRDGVLALSRARVDQAVTELTRDLGIERTAVVPPEAPIASALAQDDCVQVGLVVLINRESEMVMTALERGLVGRHVAEAMLADTGRLADGTRGSGAPGFLQAVQQNHRPTPEFRWAMWLHRRFGLARPLAEMIAQRFELMLAKTRVIAQLRALAETQLVHLVGPAATAEIAAMLKTRADAAEGAFAALEKQYPAYAALARELLVERIALAFEDAEYRTQRDQGLISEEVYEDLEEDRRHRMKVLSHRPPLDLGLEIRTMIGRVPLFAEVDAEGLKRIARLLHPLLAIQGQRIIRNGAVGREMFFIVSGSIEVRRGAEVVTLSDGEFFGEVSLLTSRRRNADVVAVSYCELLVLGKRDLDALLAAQPALKAQMEARAVSRVGTEAG